MYLLADIDVSFESCLAVMLPDTRQLRPTPAFPTLRHCLAVARTVSDVVFLSVLKVITIMEPLKPFIAILVEVLVLVAAILLYEKSQSKKNLSTGNQIV